MMKIADIVAGSFLIGIMIACGIFSYTTGEWQILLPVGFLMGAVGVMLVWAGIKGKG